MRRASLILLFIAIVAAGCASASSSEDQPRRNRNLITAEEIAALPTFTAFQIIRRLRPGWLRQRGPAGTRSSGYAAVFQDGMEMGGHDALRNITAESIELIRFINATDATTRYGTGYAGGIIEVITRR